MGDDVAVGRLGEPATSRLPYGLPPNRLVTGLGVSPPILCTDDEYPPRIDSSFSVGLPGSLRSDPLHDGVERRFDGIGGTTTSGRSRFPASTTCCVFQINE